MRKHKCKNDARKRLVDDVATEAPAQQAAERRAHAARMRMYHQESQGCDIDFNPGGSPPPSDSDDEYMQNIFREGPSPVAPTAPKTPFNRQAWKSSQDTPLSDMPWIVATVGFMCLLCAHATSVKPGKRWASGTAAPSRKKTRRTTTFPKWQTGSKAQPHNFTSCSPT